MPVVGSRCSQCHTPSSSNRALAMRSCPVNKSLMYLCPNPLPERVFLSTTNASTGRPSWNHIRPPDRCVALALLAVASSQLRCTSLCCLTGRSTIRGGVGGSGVGITVVGGPVVDMRCRSSDVKGDSEGRSRASWGVGLESPPLAPTPCWW